MQRLLGQIAYETWARIVGRTAGWNSLTDRDQDGWQRAAIAVREARLAAEPPTDPELPPDSED